MTENYVQQQDDAFRRQCSSRFRGGLSSRCTKKRPSIVPSPVTDEVLENSNQASYSGSSSVANARDSSAPSKHIARNPHSMQIAAIAVRT